MSDQHQWALELWQQLNISVAGLVHLALASQYRPAVAAQIVKDLRAGRRGLVFSVAMNPDRIECVLLTDGKRETLFAFSDDGPSPPLSKALLN